MEQHEIIPGTPVRVLCAQYSNLPKKSGSLMDGGIIQKAGSKTATEMRHYANAGDCGVVISVSGEVVILELDKNKERISVLAKELAIYHSHKNKAK